MSDFNKVVQELQKNRILQEGANARLKEIDSNMDDASISLRMIEEKEKTIVKEAKSQTKEIQKQTKEQANQTKQTKGLTDGIGGIVKSDIGGGIKKLTSNITGPMETFANAIPGVNTLGKVLGAVKDNALAASKSGAADVEVKREDARAKKKQTTLLGQMVRGISDLRESFIKGLGKLGEKGAMGLGVLAGLVLAPIVALGAFFSQLAKEVKVLNVLTGGRLAKIFAPITKFFMGIRNAFKGAGFLGKIGKTITGVIKFIKNIFAPLVRVARGSAAFMGGLAPILKFAATIGRTLGKIFLPITILMGVFDFVTGFMKGYEEDGIIGGIREGIIGVVDGLIGGLIRLVTGGVTWILDAIGLDNFAAKITQNVNEAIEGVYEAFRGIFDVIKGIFTLDFALVGSGIASIFDGVIEILTAPFDMIYGLIQDAFSFVGFSLPDFDLADFIKESINSVIGWFTTLFTDPVEALKTLWSSLVGDGGLVDLIFKPIDSAINWVLGIFGWSDEDSEFSLTQMVKDVINSVFSWIGTLFTNPVEALKSLWTTLLGGYDSLTSLLFAPIDGAINWVMGIFGWGDPEGEPFSFKALVSGMFTAAKDWVTGLFSFSDPEGEPFSFFGLVSGMFTAAKNWVTGLFSWSNPDGEEFSLFGIVTSGIKNIFSWITGLFDINIGDVIKGFIPNWVMKWLPDSLFGGSDIPEEEPEGRAVGGPIKANRPYIVGERGPELIVPNGAGQVMTATKTSGLISAASENAAMSRAGGSPVIVNNAPTTNISNGGKSATYIPVSIGDQSTLAWNGTNF
jgi:hypothetical protein